MYKFVIMETNIRCSTYILDLVESTTFQALCLCGHTTQPLMYTNAIVLYIRKQVFFCRIVKPKIVYMLENIKYVMFNC